jgi:ectoine hydroxylase-related dioxygenase (phytanoyl-CoA dioxygenase family)
MLGFRGEASVRTALSDRQIETYRRDGFMKVEGLLNPSEVAIWREAIDQAVAERGRLPDGGDMRFDGDGYYDNVFTQRINLWQTHPKVAALSLEPRLGEMACRLEGLRSVRIWHDQALYKKAWANPTNFHLDNPYWSFQSRHATTAWVALSESTLQNGCLYFLPGAHRDARFDNVDLGPSMGGLFDVYPEWSRIEATPVELAPGDCTFHNGLAPHAAGPNLTPHTRRAFAVIFMPEGSTFNGVRSVLPDEVAGALRSGEELCDDVRNPVVFSAPS